MNECTETDVRNACEALDMPYAELYENKARRIGIRVGIYLDGILLDSETMAKIVDAATEAVRDAREIFFWTEYENQNSLSGNDPHHEIYEVAFPPSEEENRNRPRQKLQEPKDRCVRGQTRNRRGHRRNLSGRKGGLLLGYRVRWKPSLRHGSRRRRKIHPVSERSLLALRARARRISVPLRLPIHLR